MKAVHLLHRVYSNKSCEGAAADKNLNMIASDMLTIFFWPISSYLNKKNAAVVVAVRMSVWHFLNV